MKTTTCNIKSLVNHVLKGTDDINVIVGPMSYRDGVHYFIVATSEHGEFCCDQIVVDSADDRSELIAVLASRHIDRKHPPLVIHDCDCELYMARLCETLWPGERITALRKSIEDEAKP